MPAFFVRFIPLSMLCIGKIQDFALVVHKKFLDIIYAAVYNISRREETGLPIGERFASCLMTERIIFSMADEMFSADIITLTDEDGNETEFEVIATLEIDGNTYYALMPVEDNENGDCVILKLEEDENGDDILSTIDDDDEYERVADVFDDEVFSEIDYDDEE